MSEKSENVSSQPQIKVRPGQIITLLGSIVIDFNEIWHADLVTEKPVEPKVHVSDRVAIKGDLGFIYPLFIYLLTYLLYLYMGHIYIYIYTYAILKWTILYNEYFKHVSRSFTCDKVKTTTTFTQRWNVTKYIYSSTVLCTAVTYLYFIWVFPFYATLHFHYISEGNIVLFTPLHLFNTYSY